MLHTDALSPVDLWSDIEALRQQAPLVHNITNLVVMNLSANVLLAAGASPVMAHAHEEIQEMAAIAQALVLNIGTLDAYWAQSMLSALNTAHKHSIPSVLDPVGAGATPYRNQIVDQILKTKAVHIVRGNASEVMSISNTAAVQTKGVDSSAQANAALDAANTLAQRIQGVVCVSGATDHILDSQGRHARLSNGHPWMARITGMGCSATSLIGAFAAIQPDIWRATTAAMALIGVAGEYAVEKAQAQGAGVGTVGCLLLDALQLMDRDTFVQRLRLNVKYQNQA